jgi:hypothetical protein
LIIRCKDKKGKADTRLQWIHPKRSPTVKPWKVYNRITWARQEKKTTKSSQFTNQISRCVKAVKGKPVKINKKRINAHAQALQT